MKRILCRVFAVLLFLLAVRCLADIATARGFAKAIAQALDAFLALVFCAGGYALARKGWGKMENPNFSPKQRVVMAVLAGLVLSAVTVYWLGFYVIGGKGDLAGIDYQVAHRDPKGNVHLDFARSDAWVIDWSNLTFQDWLSISYRSGEFTNGAQEVTYKLYVKNFFGGYEDADRDLTLTPGNGASSRLSENSPFVTYRILIQSSSPDLTGGTFYIKGGTLDPGW